MPDYVLEMCFFSVKSSEPLCNYLYTATSITHQHDTSNLLLLLFPPICKSIKKAINDFARGIPPISSFSNPMCHMAYNIVQHVLNSTPKCPALIQPTFSPWRKRITRHDKRETTLIPFQCLTPPPPDMAKVTRRTSNPTPRSQSAPQQKSGSARGGWTRWGSLGGCAIGRCGRTRREMR